jgi:uncharacterized lipoprotein YbaY
MSHRALILSLALAAVGSTHAATIKGKASYAKGATLPPGSVLHLALQDLTSHGAVVAKATVSARGKVPIGFRLKYDQDAIEKDHLYGLEVTITDPEGRALWATPAPMRVLTLGNPDSVDLALKPAGRPREASAAGPSSFHVECAEFAFDVRLEGAHAHVVLPERKLVLERVDSPSGDRYSGVGTTLSISGQAVYFEHGGKYDRTCKLAGS